MNKDKSNGVTKIKDFFTKLFVTSHNRASNARGLQDPLEEQIKLMQSKDILELLNVDEIEPQTIDQGLQTVVNNNIILDQRVLEIDDTMHQSLLHHKISALSVIQVINDVNIHSSCSDDSQSDYEDSPIKPWQQVSNYIERLGNYTVESDESALKMIPEVNQHNTKKVLKGLLLVGSNIALSDEIKTLYQEDNFLRIGAGDINGDININSIREHLLNYTIDNNTRIDIVTHGMYNNGQYSISISSNIEYEFLNYHTLLQTLSDYPLYIQLWTCHSGAVHDMMYKFKVGTIIIAHTHKLDLEDTLCADDALCRSIMHYHASTNITPQEQFLYDLGFNVGIASWGSVTKDGVITYTTTDFLTDRTLYDLTDILSDNITVDYMVDTIIRNERSTFGKYLQCNSNTAAAYDGAYYIQCKLEYFFTQQRAGSIDLKILENFLDLLVGYNSESNCTSRNTPDFDLALLNAIIYMKDNGVIKVLLKYVNNPNINIGDIPIIIAVLEDDNIELFNMLLAFGADLNITSYVDGTSPLHIASQNSLQEVATALINNGADPNIRDNKGNTPLIYAILAKEPKKEIIELLITSSNINLDIKNDDAQSALHIATKYNHINIVKLLLDAGVNVNAVNDDGDTALHLALQYHYMDIAKLLFSNSEVDIYVPNNLSLTPVQLAISLVADDHELEKLMHSKVTITRHHLNISNNKAESKIAVETDDLNKSAHDQELAVQGQDNNIYDTILT